MKYTTETSKMIIVGNELYFAIMFVSEYSHLLLEELINCAFNRLFSSHLKKQTKTKYKIHQRKETNCD